MLELDPVEFAFREFLSQTLDVIVLQATDKQIVLHQKIEPGLPDLVTTDPIRLKQVLVNLLANAVKFTDHGSVELTVAWRNVSENAAELTFQIQDTGIGISPEQIGRLFKPFSQADSSTTRRFGGTGLGLVISNQIIQMMGGDIRVDSEPGKGSTFYFHIPVQYRMHVQGFGYNDHESSADDKISDAKLLVLIADDVVMNMMLIRDLVYRLFPNARIIEAENGRQAVELFSSNPVDLVLMDIQMPEMSGIEAAQSIRRLESPLRRRVPIVALTAGAMKEDREAALASGMDEYIPKPLDRKKLRETLRRVLTDSGIISAERT
jgi:CheY-like chemotaxis protein